MPKYTIYIREADDGLWKSIIKKPDWIHNALHNLSTFDGSIIVLREDVRFCKHNAVKGLCKKGCK